jgi:putative ABC transport system permease protein
MTLDHLLRQGLRMSARDWRAGELRLLAVALVIAVAAVTSVGFLVDRIRLGLERDASQLLGADLVLISDTPIATGLQERAIAAKLQTASTVTFPSMAMNVNDADANALAAVKAVSDRYAFKTPSLRNVARTAPYMHDGSLATLQEVVEFYDLDAGEKGALAAFLRALDGASLPALVSNSRRPSLP